MAPRVYVARTALPRWFTFFAGEVDLDALLRVEEGLEDGNVLPPHEAKGACHSVHRGPGGASLGLLSVAPPVEFGR